MSLPASTPWNNALQIDTPVNSSDYRGFGGFSGSGLGYLLNTEVNHLNAYNHCPPLKSIIGKRAKAFNVAIIDVFNKNNSKPAQGPAGNPYRQILRKPNAVQTGKQFLAQHNTYLDLFGYCPLFIVRPYGVPDVISAVWNIPPWIFNVEYTGGFLNASDTTGIFKGFSMNWNGGIIQLSSDNLKLIFDDGFGTDNDINLTIPDSRLRSQEYPVTNIVAALMARNALITKRGATGILSNSTSDVAGHIPLLEPEKQAIQNDFSRYGITGQEWQVIISDANLKWQQMGFPTRDLMLFEEIEDDVNSLCDAYGYYPELLARSKGVTFDNKEKAEKMFYSGTIIPESQSRLEQLSNAIMGADNSIEFRGSFSHVSALQEENLQTAQARKELDTALEKEFKNNVLTKNQWLVELGLPAIDGGDQYYSDYIAAGQEFGNTGSSADTASTTPPNVGKSKIHLKS